MELLELMLIRSLFLQKHVIRKQIVFLTFHSGSTSLCFSAGASAAAGLVTGLASGLAAG